MASRKLIDLVHPLYVLAEKHVDGCDKAGIDVFPVCTRRSMEEQAALYAMGRESLNQVNKLRLNAGLPIIGDKDNRIVTHALPGTSFHEYAAAYDLGMMDGGKYVTSGDHPAWARVGAIARDLGLVCGMDWKGRKRDVPHFQLAGVTIEALKAGFVPA